jgi:type II secretion system protein N
MKIPRPARLWKKGKAPAAPFGGQGFRFYLGALALLLTGIIAGFHLFFPASALQQRLELEIAARTPLDARIENVSLLFPLGLKGKGIHLAARKAASAASPPAGFTVTALELTPLWRTLFGRNPGLAFQADIQGGQIEGSLWKNGSVEARLQQVAFSAPVGAGVSLLMTGQVGKGEVVGAWPLQPTSETRLNLSFARLDIGGLASLGMTSDALPLGTVSLVGSGRGNALKVERLTASGGSLEITGEGTVMLSEPLARSRLNLDLVLRPGRQLDKGLTDLLELFAQAEPDGSYRLRLTGPLTQVAIQ